MTKKDRNAFTEEAQAIVRKMTLEEKVTLMSGDVSLMQMMAAKKTGSHYNQKPYSAGGNERFHVPPLKFCDGPRGAVCGLRETTCFPVSMMRGATFDVKLEKEIGRAIGREIRAMDGNLFGGVCINLPYNPGWGRSQETYGEDSFAIGSMGSALVRGVQSESVIACLKHFAFNSMENNRFRIDIDCSKRTEREIFLPHFKDCIDTGAASVMCAYNLYHGIHCGHSAYLLKEVLKEEWGFDGFVISDFFWGIQNTVSAAEAGMDVEMCDTKYYGPKLIEAVRNGQVSEKFVDDAAVRIIRTLNAFEHQYQNSGNQYGKEMLGCREHVRLSLKAAQEGMTLIKNKNHTLPLSKKGKKIAVLGKLASRANTGDHGSSRVYPKYVVTALEGIVKEAPDSQIIFYDGNDIGHMKSLAEESDAVVFVVGLDYRDEGEYIPGSKFNNYIATKGGDRSELGLHPYDVEMLNTIGPLNKKSIAVLIGGSTITVTEWEKNISAILMAFYPGQEGGTAIVQAIFGSINPSGKLPFVLPKDESDLPQVNWNASSQHYGYYHGYHLLEKKKIKPYRPYGYGLSYTSFEMKDAFFAADKRFIKASVSVRNTGRTEGTEVVQVYAGFKNSKLDRPVKTLCGFQRVNLKPGAEKQVKITCPLEKIKYYNPEKSKFELEHMKYEIYIGSSGDNKDLIKGILDLSE